MTAIAFLCGMLFGSALSLIFFSEIYAHQQQRIGDLSRALEEVAVQLEVAEAIVAINADDELGAELWLEECYERSVN